MEVGHKHKQFICHRLIVIRHIQLIIIFRAEFHPTSTPLPLAVADGISSIQMPISFSHRLNFESRENSRLFLSMSRVKRVKMITGHYHLEF